LDGLRYVSYIPLKVKLEADQQTSFIQLQNQSLGLYHAQIPARAPDSSRVPVASVFREFFRRWVTSRLRLEYKFNWVQDSCDLHAAYWFTGSCPTMIFNGPTMPHGPWFSRR
jgi:hypothetical protein